MNYSEKKEKIWTALDIIGDVDLAEDHYVVTPKHYVNEEKAQIEIWEALKSMSYEEVLTLANETYAIGGRALQLLSDRGTEQAWAISILCHRFIELEEERRKKNPPLSLEEIREKIQSNDPIDDLPF